MRGIARDFGTGRPEALLRLSVAVQEVDPLRSTPPVPSLDQRLVAGDLLLRMGERVTGLGAGVGDTLAAS